MALDLTSFFPLQNARSTNDWMREGTLQLEFFQISITIGTNEGTVEVPTKLDEVLGMIDLSFIASAADPTDSIKLLTDGVITTGAVTVIAKTVDVGDGAITIRGFLVGRKITGSAISVTEAS